jgi:hypothetical protein
MLDYRRFSNFLIANELEKCFVPFPNQRAIKMTFAPRHRMAEVHIVTRTWTRLQTAILIRPRGKKLRTGFNTTSKAEENIFVKQTYIL